MISASCDSSELLDLEEFMPWTEITRPDYDRRGLRYASDATDAEWELVAPFMPEPKALGRPRETDLRTVWNAIQYIGATGCQWAMLPRDFPPFTTVQYYFYQMRDSGALDALNDTLAEAARLASGREATPTAGIIPSRGCASQTTARQWIVSQSRRPKAVGRAGSIWGRKQKAESGTS